MKVSVSWLRDYVDVDLSPEELARQLTLSGTKVEHVYYIGAQWRDILIGRITRLEPHPDPGVSLQLATVSLGGRGEQTVVTGAFNMTVGDKVPYAGLGVTLANGGTIQPRKLRGVLSEWMVARLQAAGVRAINNVVDVTNYVMLEYGQPMHPYDAARLPGHALVIRHARQGETLQTLDGQTRLLAPEMLVIADGAGHPVGLAGIMGGATTEV